MYKDVTDKFKTDSMMCAGGADRDACQVMYLIIQSAWMERH